MLTRTSNKTATFTKPFALGDFDEVPPADNYVVDTNENLLQGLSFSAYLIQLFAGVPNAQYPRRKELIAGTLDDLTQLCDRARTQS